MNGSKLENRHKPKSKLSARPIHHAHFSPIARANISDSMTTPTTTPTTGAVKKRVTWIAIKVSADISILKS